MVEKQKKGSTRRAGQGNWMPLLALLSLALGLALLDRGFAKWRNDPRNFPQANGVYPTAAELPPEKLAQMSNPTVQKLLAVSGAGLLLASVVLFVAFPFGANREGTWQETTE